MKLLNCTKCTDIRKLTRHWRRCGCGLSKGKYLNDGLTVVVVGPALVLGIANPDYMLARGRGLPKRPYVENYKWWVINPDWQGSHVKHLQATEVARGV